MWKNAALLKCVTNFQAQKYEICQPNLPLLEQPDHHANKIKAKFSFPTPKTVGNSEFNFIFTNLPPFSQQPNSKLELLGPESITNPDT